MKLNEDHIQEFAELEVVESLRAEGYNIDVMESRVCPSSSSDEAYILQKIQTTETANPADLVAERTEAWVCSCPAFLFKESPVTDSGAEDVGSMGTCKHLAAKVRELKATNDNNQATL
jgi:hypothetical protein